MRSGTVIGTGRNVSDAARLVRSDAADALMRNRDGVDLGLPGLWIVDHWVAAGVIGSFLVFRRIALLGAEIDFAAGADVIAGVDFGLGRESLGFRADHFLRIHDGAHALGLRIEFDEPGVSAIGMRANIEPAIMALDDGKISL